MLCISAIVTSFIYFISPDGGIKKPIRIILSLFMMTVMVYPVINLNIGNLSISEVSPEYNYDSEEYSEYFSDYILSGSKSEVEKTVSKYLEDVCKGGYSVEAQMSVSESTVTLNGIIITIAEMDTTKISVITANISSLTGVIPEVKIEE